MQREHEEEVQQEARLPHKMRHQRWESYVIQFCTTYGQQSFFSVHMANNSGIKSNYDREMPAVVCRAGPIHPSLLRTFGFSAIST